MFGFKKRRRNRYRNRPWPPAWGQYILANVPIIQTLTPAELTSLQGHIQIFLAEKRFEGCGGLEMTDEIRVTVAAQACLLQLHREGDCYPKLHEVLVYPQAYEARQISRQPDGSVREGVQVRLGESWSRGTVILSWNDVLHGASAYRDGQNVVLHEFAHQLDAESGTVNGAPPLPMRSMYVAWARILGAEYEALIEDLGFRRQTVLGSYAATNPAEFFAVATEVFFERPKLLRAKHPELYEQLTTFYHQDPAAR